MSKLNDQAFNKFKKTKTERHWNYYKDLKNQTNIAIRYEKKSYLEFCIKKMLVILNYCGKS